MDAVAKPIRKLTLEERDARRAKRILIRRALLRERLREGRVLLWKIVKSKQSDQ